MFILQQYVKGPPPLVPLHPCAPWRSCQLAACPRRRQGAGRAVWRERNQVLATLALLQAEPSASLTSARPPLPSRPAVWSQHYNKSGYL